jgi:hypothetical protein
MRTVRTLAGVTTLIVGLWMWNAFRPQRLPISRTGYLPITRIVGHQTVVTFPSALLVAETAKYTDELFAYLMFDYFRCEQSQPGVEVLLHYRNDRGQARYSLWLHFERNDLVSAIPILAKMRARNAIGSYDLRFVPVSTLRQARQQTAFFEAAYNLPPRRTLRNVPARELAAYIQRFMRLKSVTDRRIRLEIAPVPCALSRVEAEQMAGDVIAVADFYGLPLDFFLAIGAIENNYMNVPGDLDHTVWKRRPEPGDEVVGRARGRVLVRNQAVGVWQITRESLRCAHRLYLRDARDYSLLPQRLRPPWELDLDHVTPEVLTTYAGLLFRNLIDRFGGDIGRAVGAYNGGPSRPNPGYEARVRIIANYARRVLEQAAALHARPVVDTVFVAPNRDGENTRPAACVP